MPNFKMSGSESEIWSPELGTGISHTIHREKKKPAPAEATWDSLLSWPRKTASTSPKPRKAELLRLAGWTKEDTDSAELLPYY